MEAKKSDGILPGFGRNVVSTVKYNGGIIIGLLIICLLLSVMTDSFCTVRNLSNIMRQISINVILACGMTMVIILGGIDLSVGSVIAVSGCLCCGLITNVGVPSIIAIPISICAGTLEWVCNIQNHYTSFYRDLGYDEYRAGICPHIYQGNYNISR